MRGARAEVAASVLLCLLGAFLVLVAAGNDWFTASVSSPVLGARELGVTGTDVAPGARALGLVGLAGVVAIAATKRWGRVAVGLLLTLVGVGVVVLVAVVLGDSFARVQDAQVVRDAGGLDGESVRRTLWSYACALGGLFLACAGVLVAGRGRRWAALSQRYDAPAARAQEPGDVAGPRQERELWEALDRGEDPTQRSS